MDLCDVELAGGGCDGKDCVGVDSIGYQEGSEAFALIEV